MDKAKYKEEGNFTEMKRLTAHVSGRVQEVGYRDRVIQIAKAAGLGGTVENADDGRAKIIAEGNEDTLSWFAKAIEIRNTLIQVSSVNIEYSSFTGEFKMFRKIVDEGETDTRLDRAAVYLKELIGAVNNMNENIAGKIVEMKEDLSGKIDKMDQDLSGKIDKMNADLGGKMDRMLDNQEEVLAEVKNIGQGQEELVVEVKDMNRMLHKTMEEDIVDLKSDMAEVKAALKAKGII